MKVLFNLGGSATLRDINLILGDSEALREININKV